MIIDKNSLNLERDEDFSYFYRGDISAFDSLEIVLDVPLTIDGSIKTCGSFYAERSVEVKGNINSGVLEVHGYLKTSGSITASEIEVHGDLETGDTIKSYGKIEVHGNVKSGGDIDCEHREITVDGDITAAKNIKTPFDVRSKRNIKAGGNISARDVIADGFVRAGSIKLEKKIKVGECVCVDNSIECESIRAGKDILTGENITAILSITAGGAIEADGEIKAGRSINAGEYIKSGSDIEAGWGISAKTYIDCGRWIFVETNDDESEECEMVITCAELRHGRICHGNLIISE